MCYPLGVLCKGVVWGCPACPRPCTTMAFCGSDNLHTLAILSLQVQPTIAVVTMWYPVCIYEGVENCFHRGEPSGLHRQGVSQPVLIAGVTGVCVRVWQCQRPVCVSPVSTSTHGSGCCLHQGWTDLQVLRSAWQATGCLQVMCRLLLCGSCGASWGVPLPCGPASFVCLCVPRRGFGSIRVN